MRNLFAFIYRFRAFLVFLLLEVLCVYLIVRYNTYQGAAFFNSATKYVGQVLEFQSGVTDYFRLSSINNTLASENAALRKELMLYRLHAVTDSVAELDTTYYAATDSSKAYPFILYAGRVINNSVRRTNNTLTLAIGTADGIQPGMGVISPDGVVGRVKTVSEHYATVTSLLHSKMLVSAKIQKSNTFGTVKWTGGDYRTATLDYIPLHVKPAVGDTIVTSGFNTVFPEGIMIGTISNVEKEQDRSFYTIDVKLSVDFAQLSYVYVVESTKREEREELEEQAGIVDDEQ
ncbi:rod shape-determining protein MreC [Pontibacter ummariensis]|uniref:Cell shape-determining protein MreC n=1 Tax=Pontibacter ummariensis TaxID=1610492 RepID=A0A239HH47_9BACT|nr:rod shape-determining protein MreC [Pontibacter ummariensis]PRY10591.1 rod shape-determining protein MreC [Pontibacter ummariensis]SNS80471.1 rod shape-determining protein MreC [Pontibacter ummariensis]